MFSDFNFAFRQLLKSPGFAFVAITTLAIGIGLNATAFAVVRDMVLQPGIRDARHNLTAIYTKRTGPALDFRSFGYAEFMALRASKAVFADVTAWSLKLAALGQRGEVRRSLIGFVPENFLAVFGVQPLAGRFFTPAEARPGAGLAVAFAHHDFWQRMGGRPDFVGSEIQINQRSFTIIGIAPPGFGGQHVNAGPEVWLPLGALASLYGTDLLQPRATELLLVGQRQPGLGLAAARARTSVLDARLNALRSGEDPRQLVLDRPARFSLGSSRPQDEGFLNLFATLTLGLSMAVLLVACLNLANMLLARGAERRKEIAIRLSLGASRARVVRQLLAEGLVLAVVGGAAGVVLSVWSGDAMLSFAQSSFAASPFAFTVAPAIDPLLLAFSAGLSLLGILAFSLVPALRATRVDLIDDLKRQPGGSAGTERWGRFFSLQHCLIMTQIAFSLMLLFSAGLFVRGSFAAAERDPGYNPAGQLVANLDFSLAGLRGDELLRRQAALLERAKTLPGVTAVALASGVPFNFELRFFRLYAAGSALPENAATAAPRAGYTAVTDGYFSSLGIPLLRGRDFTTRESTQPGTPGVAIIDESLARALFPGEDALGHRLVLNPKDAVDHPEREIEIVGLVRSAHEDIFAATAPMRLYRPLGQMGEANTYVHLKLASPTIEASAIDALRRALRELDPATPALSIRPLRDFTDKNINLLLVRLAASSFGVFGVVALALAIVGVYGVKAYAVARRTRDIGIRLALGAPPREVVKLILRQGVAQIAVATAGGLVLSLLAGQALSKMIYHVNPLDPVLLAASAAVIALAALLACWLPARRATKVDPMVALRSE